MNYVKAKKLKMSQVFKDDKVVPVTLAQIIMKPDEVEFEVGKRLRVSATSKSKGFQGVVKRHGFRGGPKTHGQKNRLRAPGSIGSTAPQHVFRGRKMAGRMGGKRVTLKHVAIVDFDKSINVVFLKGAIPGRRGALLELRPQQ